MKLLLRLAVLALAALGARDLYLRLRPRFDQARDTTTSVLEDTLEPAVRDAASTLGQATTDAAHTVADAGRAAADEVTGATTEPATTEPATGEPATAGTTRAGASASPGGTAR